MRTIHFVLAHSNHLRLFIIRNGRICNGIHRKNENGMFGKKQELSNNQTPNSLEQNTILRMVANLLYKLTQLFVSNCIQIK